MPLGWELFRIPFPRKGRNNERWADTLTGEQSAGIADQRNHRFGYADRAEAIEIVNLRLKLGLEQDKPQAVMEQASAVNPTAALLGEAQVVFAGGAITSQLYDRDKLEPEAGSSVRPSSCRWIPPWSYHRVGPVRSTPTAICFWNWRHERRNVDETK